MPEAEPSESDPEQPAGRGDGFDPGVLENLRLGHDIRFVLVTVGGGAARIGREIARQHLRYLETVAINCDTKIQEFDEFDRRVCLTSEESTGDDTRGSPVAGGHLAREAQAALERIFDGATFVTVVCTLGGGSGTGALPFVLEAACRACEVLSVFVVKPFRLERERRAVAERALARLQFVDAFEEMQQRGLASLQVLDNETLVREARKMPVGRLAAHWAQSIADHVEKSFLAPAEAAVEAGRVSGLSDPTAVQRIPPALEPVSPLVPASVPEPPSIDPSDSPPIPVTRSPEIELTFEVVGPAAPGPFL
jgi:hypothetical protein